MYCFNTLVLKSIWNFHWSKSIVGLPCFCSKSTNFWPKRHHAEFWNIFNMIWIRMNVVMDSESCFLFSLVLASKARLSWYRRGNLGSPRYHTLISPRDRTLTSPRPVIPSPHLDFLTRVFIPSPHLDIHTFTSPRFFVCSVQHTLASPRLCFLSTIFLQLF